MFKAGHKYKYLVLRTEYRVTVRGLDSDIIKAQAINQLRTEHSNIPVYGGHCHSSHHADKQWVNTITNSEQLLATTLGALQSLSGTQEKTDAIFSLVI